MDNVPFEWDPVKNRANERKHGVRFEVAQLAFLDEQALLIHDPDHSREEERYLLLGWAGRALLVVAHCCRKTDGIIRIISAREATRRERARYEEETP